MLILYRVSQNKRLRSQLCFLSLPPSITVVSEKHYLFNNNNKNFKYDTTNSVRTPSFLMPKKKSPWLRQYQSYISNWYVNGKVFTSTTTWEPKNLIFFSRKFEIEFDLYFDLCWRVEIIQVGLNMHLYVDIGDASSSLWGSTSSFYFLFVKCSFRVSMIGMFVV